MNDSRLVLDCIMPEVWCSYEAPDPRETAWLGFSAAQRIGWRSLAWQRMIRHISKEIIERMVEGIVATMVSQIEAEQEALR